VPFYGFRKKSRATLLGTSRLFFAILWFTALPTYSCSDTILLQLDMPRVSDYKSKLKMLEYPFAGEF